MKKADGKQNTKAGPGKSAAFKVSLFAALFFIALSGCEGAAKSPQADVLPAEDAELRDEEGEAAADTFFTEGGENADGVGAPLPAGTPLPNVPEEADRADGTAKEPGGAANEAEGAAQSTGASEERESETAQDPADAGHERSADTQSVGNTADEAEAEWKEAYIALIRALEEQGSGACIIDPNSPEGHRCGYDYRLFRISEDEVPELYYCCVVRSLGEGISRYGEGTVTEIASGDACAPYLTRAEEILAEGDAQTLLFFLEK